MPTAKPIEERPTPGPADIRLRAAFLVSGIGDWIYRLAIPVLVLKITGSATSTALAYAIEFIPYIVIGLFAGVIADRFDRRRVMILCDLSSAVLALAVTTLATLDRPPLAAIYLCAFLLACVRPFYFPAFQGFLVDVVPERRLARVNSWTQTVDSALGFIGPVAGITAVAALGVPVSALVNALSFGASALLITAIATTPAPAAGPTTAARIAKDFADGLRALRTMRAVLWGTVLMALSNLAAWTVEGSLFYLVLEVEEKPKVVLGLVLGAQGLGAVLGGVLAPRLTDRYRLGPLLAFGMGLSGATMVLPALVPTWWAVLIAWGVEGVATSLVIVSWFTARQKVVPSEVIGRVVSVSRAAAYATIPLGAVLGGRLVSGASPTRTLFVCAAVVQAVVFLGTAFSPVVRIDPGPGAAPNGSDSGADSGDGAAETDAVEAG
ncbi:MFS transporter [Kitasatospora purpeofusca]|uniref:MFS transporter n=1 Tax=Kitasatospora purpeofusca TaxID=67352 RepID=UPI00224CC8A8|nr:MFS transporter [Kitasatospora purpeofusca]MCX4689625.1 MFS transporter [Kitasatospora purpeofusca]